MALDNPKKPAGTIYLGVSHETTVEGLDIMQSSIRREEWNKNTQELYLFRIREKAAEKAKQILGSAYTERQKIIDSAYADAQKIRDEANTHLEQAKQQDEQSRVLQEEAQLKFDVSEEKGFDSGLNQATDEITDFRITMGSTLLSVIDAIEKQSELIFEQWRDDIVELVRICVEKSNALTMSKEHAQILKNLVITSVKQLLDKRQINVYVHPDDEETVAQLFNFAKEAMPDIKHWTINADPNLQIGDLIAECSINALHNKYEDRIAMVENILNKLSLPKDSEDKPNLDNVHQSVEEQRQKINDLVPEIANQATDEQHENTALEDHSTDTTDNSALEDHSPQGQNADSADNSALESQDTQGQNTDNKPLNESNDYNKDADSNLDSKNSKDGINNVQNNNADIPSQNLSEPDPNNSPAHDKTSNQDNIANALDESTAQAIPNTENPQSVAQDDAENAQKEQQDAAQKLIEDLEQELLPLPETESTDFDNSDNSSELNSVFATGGFLATPPKANT